MSICQHSIAPSEAMPRSPRNKYITSQNERFLVGEVNVPRVSWTYYSVRPVKRQRSCYSLVESGHSARTVSQIRRSRHKLVSSIVRTLCSGKIGRAHSHNIAQSSSFSSDCAHRIGSGDFQASGTQTRSSMHHRSAFRSHPRCSLPCHRAYMK